jgi:Domain of unknown function (DUF4118)
LTYAGGVATTPDAPVGPEHHLVTAGVLIGSFGPIVAAGVLVPIRQHIDSANVALIFVVLVVVAAAVGGRWGGVIGAVTSTLTFDFFFTHPYDTLRMNRLREVVTTALLLIVGLVVGEIVVWAHRGHRAAQRGRDEVERLHRVAEQVVSGADATAVLQSVRAELSDLLSLRGCDFEEPPFGAPLPRLGRNGSIATSHHRFVRGEMALPAEGLEIPVLGNGRQLGRLVLAPEPRVGVAIEERVAAIALSDQLGAALAATRPDPGPEHTGGEYPWDS